jgi:hypothetical protein
MQQLVEIQSQLGDCLLGFAVDAEVDQVVAEMRADQEFGRQVRDRARALPRVRRGSADPALQQPVAGCPELEPINRLLAQLQQARQGPATAIRSSWTMWICAFRRRRPRAKHHPPGAARRQTAIVLADDFQSARR